MCWSEKNDSNCDTCQEIFDKCTHETTFTNKDGKEECVFCEKIIEKKSDEVCPYCNTKYTYIQVCSPRCGMR